jgi:hypothetical protein
MYLPTDITTTSRFPTNNKFVRFTTIIYTGYVALTVRSVKYELEKWKKSVLIYRYFKVRSQFLSGGAERER